MNNLNCICPRCKFSYKIPLEKELLRTKPMNALYWSCYIKIISEELGLFPDECHEELKNLFNPKDSKLKLGSKIGGTTTRLTRKEFTAYLEKIRIWAQTEHNILLPEQEKNEN